ncbi:MAG TPA: EAL domain-containing protein [Mycobacteriales bacterium]|nr:EAL domain-containing protein [Mycobacteriales bacterium]
MGSDLTAAIGQTIDPLRLMQRVTDRTVELIDAADAVMVGLADALGICYVVGTGQQLAHLGTRVGLDTSLSGLAIQSGQVERADDTETDPRVDREACRRLGVASLVCVPLRRGQDSIGVLAVNAHRPYAFNEGDVATLTQLADFISVVVGSACDLSRVKSQLLRMSQGTLDAAHLGGLGAASAQAATRYMVSVLNPDTLDQVDSGDRIRSVIDDPDMLSVVFQPIFDLQTNQVSAVEALARFEVAPYRAPNIWFDDAARLGLGVELELLAAAKAVSYIDRLPEGVDLTINAGPEAVLSGRLRKLLVPSSRIVLELTEHTMVDDYPRLISALQSMRQAGIRVSIDDTGAGYSSLTHILRLAPDFIKLDRDLVTGIDVDPVRRALAASLVTFACGTGAQIIAEGVEDQAELDTLRNLGVHFAQGYHLGHPAPIGALAMRHAPSSKLHVLDGTTA